MKRPQLLGAILKAIGVWNGVAGIATLPSAIAFSHDYPDEQAFFLMMADTFATPSVLILSGYFLIFFTDWFVRIGYPTIDLTEEDANGDDNGADLFSVILKAMGIWYIVVGIARLPYALAAAYRSTGGAFLDRVAYAGIEIVCGCFLLFTTDWLVRMAYRARVGPSDDESQDAPPPDSSPA